MLVGSMANTLGGGGGFCAGTEEVVFHQRINGTAFVFSAALPALLAVAASTAISYMVSQPSILTTLQDNIRTLRSVLDRVECICIPGDAISPLVHIQVRSKLDKHPDTPQEKHERGKNSLAIGAISLSVPSSQPTALVNGHDLSVDEQMRLLQAIVDEALEHGVMLMRHKRLQSIAPRQLEVGPESRPSIRVAVSAAFTRKEMEKAANVIKSACVKVLGKRR